MYIVVVFFFLLMTLLGVNFLSLSTITFVIKGTNDTAYVCIFTESGPRQIQSSSRNVRVSVRLFVPSRLIVDYAQTVLEFQSFIIK